MGCDGGDPWPSYNYVKKYGLESANSYPIHMFVLNSLHVPKLRARHIVYLSDTKPN